MTRVLTLYSLSARVSRISWEGDSVRSMKSQISTNNIRVLRRGLVMALDFALRRWRDELYEQGLTRGEMTGTQNTLAY